MWTTYNNLRMWFANWEHDLVELGFADRKDNGKVIIPPDQIKRILNFDESSLSLDSGTGTRGG